jgi:hypothetical protein
MDFLITMRIDGDLYTQMSLSAVKQHKKKRAVMEEACRVYLKVLEEQENLRKKASEEASLVEYRRLEDLRTGVIKPLSQF